MHVYAMLYRSNSHTCHVTVITDSVGFESVMSDVAGCFLILCQVHGYRVIYDGGDMFFTYPQFVNKDFNNILALILDRTHTHTTRKQIPGGSWI